MIEADGDNDAKKVIKALSFPAMDDDALASSYIQRVLSAVAKWRVKMHSVSSSMEELDEPPETLSLFLTSMYHMMFFICDMTSYNEGYFGLRSAHLTIM